MAAQQLLQSSASGRDRQKAAQLAKSALARDPAAIPAVDTLALLAGLQGQAGAARALFGYAVILSRRDLSSQLWSVEDAVAHQDVNGALLHYDIALRASNRAPDILFPVLSQALAGAPIRSALATRLNERPLWSEAFLAYTADKGPDFRATAQLFLDLRRRGVVPLDYVEASLINRLIGGGASDEAWTYYAATHTGADRRHSRDTQFTASPVHPTAFDWNIVDDPSISASIQRDGNTGELFFSAGPTVGGAVARQMQALPPGRYILDGRSVGVDQAQGQLPYWSLSCVNGQEIGRVEVSSSQRDGGRFTGIFEVPVNCSMQWLNLNIRATDNAQGLQGTVRSVSIRPIGGPPFSRNRAFSF